MNDRKDGLHNATYLRRGSRTVNTVRRSSDRASAVPPWPFAISRTMYKP